MPLPASIPTQAYRKAFDLYLRRGIPIELPLKAALQEHPTAHFYFGGGKAVELANIGHLQDVIDRANERRLHPHQVFEGVDGAHDDWRGIDARLGIPSVQRVYR